MTDEAPTEPTELSELSRNVLSRARDGDPSPAALAELRRAVTARIGPGGSSGGGAAPRPRAPLVVAGAVGVVALGVVGYLASDGWTPGAPATATATDHDGMSGAQPDDAAPARVVAPATEVAAAQEPRAAAAGPTAAVGVGSAPRGRGGSLDEAAYVESIRRTIERDAGRALHLARRHRSVFPDGLLAEEAEALEVEAAARLGDGRGARALADSFFERHPSSPYRRRIERALAALADLSTRP